jgi:hypothetical protein
VAITRQMRDVDLNVRMLSSVPYGLLPDYYKQLGKHAEFVYSGSFWVASLPGGRRSWRVWLTPISTATRYAWLASSGSPPGRCIDISPGLQNNEG